MKTLKVMVYSSSSTGLVPLGRAFQRLEKEASGRLAVSARSGDDLFDRRQVERFLEQVKGMDHLLVILHGGKTSCPFFDELMEAVAGTRRYIHPSDQDDLELSRRHSSDFGSESFQEMVKYLKFGGEENWYHLLRSLLGLEARPPRPQPCQAMYHPKLGAVDSLEDYCRGLGLEPAELCQGRRPVLGLWFNQHYWLEGNLKPVDAMIQEMERQGAVALCCFYRRYPDPMLDVKGTAWVIEHYFRWQGRTLIHALISPMMFSLSQMGRGEEKLLKDLGVPVLQAMNLLGTRKFWEETQQAVSPMDVCISVAQPEFDGNLITVPMATRESGRRDPLTGAVLSRMEPVGERIAKIVRLARRWAQLRLKPNREKRVAIVLHNYPPRNDKIGSAYGLDSFASVSRLLARLKEQGYQVDDTYDDPQKLAEALVGGLTVDQRWLTPEAMARRAVDQAGPELHRKWHEELPAATRAHQEKDWGPSPGELFVHQDRVMINGLVTGKVYIGIQPPRGFVEQPEKIHDPYLAPSHHYLYYYRWLRDVFQADAVLHIGKHGSLEWLPGKSVALGPECYPDLAIMEIPNIYPYIINDPSEGAQAKRRSYCCIIDHLIPVMTNADSYEELAEVDQRIMDYLHAKSMNPDRLPVLRQEIWNAVEKAELHHDLQVDKDGALADFDAFLEKLHAYLGEVGDTAIADGLHILGLAPQDQPLVELATQIVRLPNGEVPSLREAIARHWGYDYDALLAQRGRPDPTGRFPTNAKAIEGIHHMCLEVVGRAAQGQRHELAGENPEIGRVVDFLLETLLPRLAATTDELDNALAALSGRFVPPGGSGAPTRGQSDILPTGRNFYSVDPLKIPTPGAWRVGVELARDLVDRHRQETGRPPDNLGMVIWGGPTMRTQGEDIAEALFLMGLKPVWQEKSGRVEGLEVIPLEELEFPRVDITFRTSGFFRDSFPNLAELMDQAVNMAAALEEPMESNFLRRNVLRELEVLDKQGISPEDAWREACLRVYSDPPGVYGTGLPQTIDAKVWEKREDLGEIWVEWGGYAYGKDIYGAKRHDNFRRRLKDINLVVKNEDSREYDLLSSDDFNAYFGGFVCAVQTVSGVQPRAYSGDASDPRRVKNRSLQEETRHIFRSRILNPKWMQGLMRHGYKGAGDLSRTVDNAFHWDATSGVIEDWMYQGLAEKYAFDPKMQQWLKEVNPHALQNITERLLEAEARGMWKPDPETKERLQNLYLEAEAEIEDGTA